MSNHVGLMLSMLFLSILIVFSGELISYQQANAIFISDVSQVAHHLQVYGYENTYVSSIQDKYSFSYVKCKESLNEENEMVIYLECKKEYKSFTEFFSYMSDELTCSITIYR